MGNSPKTRSTRPVKPPGEALRGRSFPSPPTRLGKHPITASVEDDWCPVRADRGAVAHGHSLTGPLLSELFPNALHGDAISESRKTPARLRLSQPPGPQIGSRTQARWLSEFDLNTPIA